MIFLTVGSADPFDRMVRAVDEWAASRGRKDVFAQIGKGRYHPRYVQAVPFLSPAEFRERVRAARLMVAHAGMGSIITALEAGRPMIIMPKLARFGEHRNDHQVATAKRLGQRQGIIVAWDENDLATKLDGELRLCTPTIISPVASSELIGAIRVFIAQPEETQAQDAAREPDDSLPAEAETFACKNTVRMGAERWRLRDWLSGFTK